MTRIKRISFERFSEIATVHGLYRVGHSAGLLRRSAWGLLVTVLFGTVVAFSTMTLIEHFSYLHLTEAEKVTESSMTFPSVTICHGNNYKLKAFDSIVHNVSQLVDKLIKSTIQKSLNAKEIIPSSHSDVAVEFAHAYLNSTVMKQLSATPDGLYWNFQDWCKFSLVTTCKYPGDFRDYFFSQSLGFCKTFNYDSKYAQTAPGYAFGLSLKLYIDERGKVPLFNDNGAGAILMVHPQNVYPNPYTDGILLPLGYESHISMRKMAFTRLKKPYKSNCTDGKGSFLIYPGRYTVQNCQYSCFLKHLLEECGYREIAYQYHKPKEFEESLKRTRKKNMNAVELIGCIQKMVQNDAKNKVKNCHCQPACNEEKILTRVSYTQWPHPSDAEYYRVLVSNFSNRKGLTKEELYQSLISIRVFFDELGYDKISESPRSSLTNLFSQIGGHFGLWIGASVFSVTEIIIYIINCILSLCKRKVDTEKDSDTVVTTFGGVDNSTNINQFAWERENSN